MLSVTLSVVLSEMLKSEKRSKKVRKMSPEGWISVPGRHRPARTDGQGGAVLEGADSPGDEEAPSNPLKAPGQLAVDLFACVAVRPGGGPKMTRPLDLSFLCLLYCATTFLGAENSEVFPPGPVAVAVMFCPSLIVFVVEKVKEMLPVPPVETVLEPRRVLPSSVPEGLEKNCN